MNLHVTSSVVPPNDPAGPPSDIMIAQLVGQVYETAPAHEQSRLLGHLLRPLGILSLVAVANGIFAKVWFRSGQQTLNIRVEDVHNVHVSDVIDLVSYVQQVSVEAVDGLAQMLVASPALVGSAAAALLVTALLQRARTRRVRTNEIDDQT